MPFLSQMLRNALLLSAVFMVCMGQTFQYSRGWTNGKRAMASTHFHRDAENGPELFELQDGDRKLERCLLQLQHFVRNPLLLRSSLNPNQSNNNNLFGNHHQSNEFLDELSAVDGNDYAKH